MAGGIRACSFGLPQSNSLPSPGTRLLSEAGLEDGLLPGRPSALGKWFAFSMTLVLSYGIGAGGKVTVHQANLTWMGIYMNVVTMATITSNLYQTYSANLMKRGLGGSQGPCTLP